MVCANEAFEYIPMLKTWNKRWTNLLGQPLSGSCIDKDEFLPICHFSRCAHWANVTCLRHITLRVSDEENNATYPKNMLHVVYTRLNVMNKAWAPENSFYEFCQAASTLKAGRDPGSCHIDDINLFRDVMISGPVFCLLRNWRFFVCFPIVIVLFRTLFMVVIRRN